MAIKRYTQNESAPGVPNEVTHLDFTTDEYGGIEKAEEMKVIKEQVRATEYARYTTVDDLVSTDTEKPLSANQGKVLKDNIDTVELQTNELTQIVATKDQQNLNQHNSMQKRLAVTEAETYNGSDLENYEPTNEVGIATDGTDISASVEDGSVELVTEGKSWDNPVQDSDMTIDTDEDGICDSFDDNGTATLTLGVDSDGQKLEVTASSIIGDRGISQIIKGMSAGDILNVQFDYKYSNVVNTSTRVRLYFYDSSDAEISNNTTGALLTNTIHERFSYNFTCPASTTYIKLVPYIRVNVSNESEGVIYYRNFAINNLTQLDDIGLSTIDALIKYPYHIGLVSSLPHDVESVGVNVLNEQTLKNIVLLDNYYYLPLSVDFATNRLYDINLQPNINYKLSAIIQGLGGIEQLRIRLYYVDGSYDQFLTGNALDGIDTNVSITIQANNLPLDYIVFSRGTSGHELLVKQNSLQIELGSSATPYQPYKSNHAHCPVVLNQVPTAKDTFNFKTGVHGVNVAINEDIYTKTSWETWQELTDTIIFYKTLTSLNLLDLKVLSNSIAIGGFLKIGNVSFPVDSNDSANAKDIELFAANINGNFFIRILKSRLGGITSGDFETWLTSQGSSWLQYELADASKYTVQYPPQNLIAYKGGQISRIPMLRDNGISTGGTVSLGTIPISRMGDVYEYIGAESSLVDPDDITLAGDGLSFAVAGGGDNEVYDYVGYYNTAHSTYPVQQVQYTTDNVASKLNDILFLKSPDENMWKLTLSVDNSGVVTVGSIAV